MADVVAYKQYNKRDRRAVLETDLSKGMMSTDGAIEDGYLKSLVNCAYEKETSAIVPRPGLRVCNTVFPAEDDSGGSVLNDIYIKASKHCVENGVEYDQVIVCKAHSDEATETTVWVLTVSAVADHLPCQFSSDYYGEVAFSDYVVCNTPVTCYLYSAKSPSIHDVYFSPDNYHRIEFPVGEFAFGNSFYFMGEDSLSNKGLLRTVFNEFYERYEFELVTPKEPTVSEAVTYGYNMLRGNSAYSFSDQYTASEIQFEGILPYVSDSTHTFSKLMMTPKKGQPVDLRCYFNAPANTTYVVKWESREPTASDWTPLQTINSFNSNNALTLKNFNAQDKEVMIRVSAYPTGQEDLVKAIVVGFDFTVSSYGTAKSLEQKNYDLTTASGMESWKGRSVIWGLPEDPTILFLSDYDDPSYFPYPNNIVVFNEPIIYCVEFMDSLAVFTTEKLYQVSLGDDGNSWKTTILQSHLTIEPWDKHLIQTVRNMLYFKSGNYYYMIVPKAQSTTGELTIAPITTPITSFFDKFSVNVQYILQHAYPNSTNTGMYDGNYELLTYFNFLDYEDIHNIYAYTFNNTQAILHFDVIYNTVDRTWKVWVFEAPTLIFPYKQEATRSGLLASMAVIDRVDFSEDPENPTTTPQRILQIYCWDKMIVRSCYIPAYSEIMYNPDNATAEIFTYVLHINEDFATISDHTLRFYSDLYARFDTHTCIVSNVGDYYYGYSKSNILTIVNNVYKNAEDYYTFRNFQFIDTGYRNDELHYKKRYKEIQLQINNLDKQDMNFGMDYILDGSPRKILYKYDVAQMIDEMQPEYGVVYIDSTPYLDTELSSIDNTNQWTLDQGLTPEVTLWKIRVAVSGKGYAPRFRLYSRNEKRFELLNINWISKIMNMR